MRTILVTAGVIIRRKKVLVAQRRREGLHGGLWEFPGGKVEDGEDPRRALERELKEELDIDTEAGEVLETAFQIYPEYPILLLAYRCRIKRGNPRPIGCQGLRWVGLKELKKLAMPPADDPIRFWLSRPKSGLL